MIPASFFRHPLLRLAVAVVFTAASLHFWWGKPGEVIHAPGINIGHAGHPPGELGPIAGLVYSLGPSLTARTAQLFFGSASLPVWPAVAAVFAGLLLKGLTLWRDHRLTAGLGNSFLAFGFLAGLLGVVLLSTSQGEIGPGVLFLMAAAVSGLLTGPATAPWAIAGVCPP